MSPKVSLHTVVLPNLVHTSLKSPKIALKEVLNDRIERSFEMRFLYLP